MIFTGYGLFIPHNERLSARIEKEVENADDFNHGVIGTDIICGSVNNDRVSSNLAINCGFDYYDRLRHTLDQEYFQTTIKVTGVSAPVIFSQPIIGNSAAVKGGKANGENQLQ